MCSPCGIQESISLCSLAACHALEPCHTKPAAARVGVSGDAGRSCAVAGCRALEGAAFTGPNRALSALIELLVAASCMGMTHERIDRSISTVTWHHSRQDLHLATPQEVPMPVSCNGL